MQDHFVLIILAMAAAFGALVFLQVVFRKTLMKRGPLPRPKD